MSISPPGLKASPNPAPSAFPTMPFGKCGARSRSGEQSLKNIARPPRVYRAGSSSAARQLISLATALPLPDKPSSAVLPFANLSGDPEQDYFADGMVEEIITATRSSSCRFPRRARSAGAALTDREAVSTVRCRRGREPRFCLISVPRASAAIASDVRRSPRRATRASSSASRSTPEPAVSCAAYRENSEQPTAGL